MTAETRANTVTTGEQASPAVARDSDGDFVVVWQSDGQDGAGYGVYAQRYNASGVAQGTEFRVNTTTAGAQQNAAVGMDATGNFVVAWQSPDAGGTGVFAQRYNAAGVAQGAEFLVNTSTANGQANASVAVDSDGDFVVVWQSAHGATTDIYAQRYNAAGVAQGAETLVNTTTADAQTAPSVAMDSGGNFVVAWTSTGQDSGATDGVYAQRFNAAGVAQGSEFLVNTTTADAQSQPAVAWAASGGFVIAWRSNGQDGGGTGIYAQRYNSSGVAQGSEFRVNTTTANAQDDPSIALDDDGDFTIVWRSSGQDGSDYGVYGQRYTAAGVARGSEFRVNTTTSGPQTAPAVATDSDGDLVIAWQSYGQDAAGSFGIYVNRLAASPVTSTPDLAAASDTGASSTDNVTETTLPTFTGTADPGATVTLLRDGVSQGSTTADSSGNWSFTAASAWAAATYAVTATATDGGVTGSASAALSVTVTASSTSTSTSPPPPPVVTSVPITGGTVVTTTDPSFGSESVSLTVTESGDSPASVNLATPNEVQADLTLSYSNTPNLQVTSSGPLALFTLANGFMHVPDFMKVEPLVVSWLAQNIHDESLLIRQMTLSIGPYGNAGFSFGGLPGAEAMVLSAAAPAGDLELSGADSGAMSLATAPTGSLALSGGTSSRAREVVGLVMDRSAATLPVQLDNVDFAGVRGSGDLRGGGGANILVGDRAPQSMLAGAGNDSVDGGGGNDTLNGNQGDDLVQGGIGADDVRGGRGNDLALGGAGNDTAWGDLGDDTVNGNEGNDRVTGGDGNDVLFGGKDRDSVQGDSGDDRLYGDLGDDTLNGGAGADTLTGGGGGDRFQLATGSGRELVTDFSFADGDRVLLAPGTIFTQGSEGGSAAIVLADGSKLVLSGVAAGTATSDWVVVG